MASPASPMQFSAFLQMVAEFAPSMVSYEEREELRRTLVKDQSKLKRKRALSSSQSVAQLEDSMELDGDGEKSSCKKSKTTEESDLKTTEDIKAPVDDVSLIARTFLKLADMLASGIISYLLERYGLMRPDAVTIDQTKILTKASPRSDTTKSNTTTFHANMEDPLVKQCIDKNLEMSTSCLVSLLAQHKSLAYVLLARHDYPGSSSF